MTTPPDRSLEQRRAALARANDIRSKRSRLKADMKAGKVSALAVLADPPEFAETMSVTDLLRSSPRIGKSGVATILRRTATSPSKTLGGLSDRQRAEIAELLRERSPALRSAA